MSSYDFYAPVRVLFGEGSLKKLHTLEMPGKKALLVISNGISGYVCHLCDRRSKADENRSAGIHRLSGL